MTGTVTAFDAASGKQLWQKPGTSELLPMYTSHSFSPIVERGLVIFHVGGHDKGALTAYDVNTGEVKWSWAGDGPGYGSPMIAEFGGVRQLVTNTQGKLIGVDPATGTLLWEQPFESSNFTNSLTPVVVGQTVMLSNNDKPATAISIARQNNKWITATAWENPDGQTRMTNAVVLGDAIFGLSTRNMGQYFSARREDRQDAVDRPSRGRPATPRSLRSGNLVFSLEDDGELVVFRAERRGVRAGEALQGRRQRDVGRAVDLRQSDLRQGRLDAHALDVELTGSRSRILVLASPFVFRFGSRFAVRCSLFAIRGSRFAVRATRFGVRRGALTANVSQHVAGPLGGPPPSTHRAVHTESRLEFGERRQPGVAA